MHIVTLNKEGLNFWKDKGKPGERIMFDQHVGTSLMLRLGNNVCRAPDGEAVRSGTAPILIICPEGHAEIILLTAVLAKLKEQFPSRTIAVATSPKHAPLLDNLGMDGFEVLPYPVLPDDYDRFPVRVSLEHAEADSPKESLIQVFATRCGLGALKKPECIVALTADEMQAAALRYPRLPNERRLAVQLQAHGASRAYPATLMQAVIALALQDGWRVFTFGEPGTLGDPPAGSGAASVLVNLTSARPAIEFRESLAILQTCDVVLAADSSLAVAAGALGLPTVALYASVRGDSRMGIFASVTTLQGRARCAPCWHTGQGFPKGQNCAAVRYCEAIASIEPDRVFKAVKRKMDELERRQRQKSN